MSNAMTLFGNNTALPAFIKNLEVDATTKALAGGTASGRRVSIKGSVFRMIVDGEQVAVNEDRAMNVVVVAAAPYVNRQYYEGTYQEGVIEAPTCYSTDGKTPDKAIESPQGKTCDSCPQNIAGSGLKDSRACRYQQRLAVVLEGDLAGPVYQLALPATSLFGKGDANNTKMPLQAYARFLAQNGAPITAVVTEMRFDTQSATPKLTFKATRPLTEEEFGVVTEQGSSADADQAVKLSVFAVDTKGKKKGSNPVATPVQAAAEPEAAAPAAEAEPKEAPKTKPPVTRPAARPVASVIASWDEE